MVLEKYMQACAACMAVLAPDALLCMQDSGSSASMGRSQVSTSSRDPLAAYPRSPPPHLQPAGTGAQLTPDAKPVQQVTAGSATDPPNAECLLCDPCLEWVAVLALVS